MYLIIGIMMMWLIVVIVNSIARQIVKAKTKTKYVEGLFENGFIDAKVLFVKRFRALSNISLIKQLDVSKAYTLILEKSGAAITEAYQFNTFDHTENKQFFNITLFVLKDKRIIELGYDYAMILYTGKDHEWANAIINDLANCKADRTHVVGFARNEVMN